MPDRNIRLRVLRLLRGDFRPDDIVRLFLFARDKIGGRESVKEVGDFVAHHSERDQGTVFRNTRDWFDISTFIILSTQAELPLEISMPPNAARFLKASLKRLDNRSILSGTGMDKAEATREVTGLVDALITLPDGNQTLGECSHNQYRLFRYLTTLLTIQPAFDGEKLFTDLLETLVRKEVLHRAETNAFRQFKKGICLFAVTVMHNCVVRLEAGVSSTLFASYNEREQNLNVYAPISFSQTTDQLAAPIYSVSGPFSDLCSSDLPQGEDWHHLDLEVNSDQALTVLY